MAVSRLCRHVYILEVGLGVGEGQSPAMPSRIISLSKFWTGCSAQKVLFLVEGQPRIFLAEERCCAESGQIR